MPNVIGIRFKSCGKIYNFEANGLEVTKGDRVIVESEFGLSIGQVITGPVSLDMPERDLKKVLRVATEEDLRQKQDNEKFERDARSFCLDRIMARGLPMKLVCSEVTLDRKRIVFYFTADGRIDFRELVKDLPDIAILVEPLLVVRRILREQLGILHHHLLTIARDDEVCRRLMTIPGVGPVVALTYRATVDVPARFRNSRAVGAVLGLTPCKYQSGESNYTGAISKCGDEMMRVMLYEAAQILLMRSTQWSWLKAWAMQVARRRGMKKAIVALARRLAVIMHRIWTDGTEFCWTRQEAAAA